MGKKHFCFLQTAETGNRTPNSGVKGSGANHYPRAYAPHQTVLKKLNAECRDLCSLKVSPNNLATFKPETLLQKVKVHAPILHDVLGEISNKENKKKREVVTSDGPKAMKGAALLKSRNPHMSAMQHINGLLLDLGETKYKTINILAKSNYSVAPSTMSKKKYRLHNTTQTV